MATEAQLLRYLRNEAMRDPARRGRDVPKRQRTARVIDPTRALANPQDTLGHPPRGRKRRANRG